MRMRVSFNGMHRPVSFFWTSLTASGRLSVPTLSPGLQSVKPFKVAPITLPRLTKLELGHLIVEDSLTLALIAKFASNLLDLSFWNISLLCRHGDHNDQRNIWAGLFEKLARLPHLHLNHLLVGMLSEDSSYVQFQVSDKVLLKQKEFSGKNMAAFFEEIAEQITLVPRAIPGPTYEFNEDEEMDDGDEDEDEGESSEDELVGLPEDYEDEYE